jgi:hypothetical protein
VVAIATVPAPTVRGAARVTPATVAAIADVPSPTIPSQFQVFLTEGDADALVTPQSSGAIGNALELDAGASTGREGDDGKADSLEGGVLIGAGLES